MQVLYNGERIFILLIPVFAYVFTYDLISHM